MKITTLHLDNGVVTGRDSVEFDQSRCPFYIMLPEHYRPTGDCRCDDPDHLEMSEWGYIWGEDFRGEPRWVSPNDYQEALR